ncbi:MAG: hypothetical protein LAO51_07300 [Acidobacteriia bacterium]|nr:hypothetical protein [Terriglobia bacterium]
MKALALLSGGLDGRLAARLVREQGVETEAVHFETAFLRAERTRAARSTPELPVEVVDVAREHFESVVVRPKHGYGTAMNPCIDCRIFMLRKAASLARERGADLVVTGEVLGQTRMSQRRESLLRIERESGLVGRLLRPLSAAHLPPTAAETDGRIDRSRLGDLEGRSRTAQQALARGLGVGDGPAPGSGCCLLADLGFSRRLRDLLAHGGSSYPGRDGLLRLRLGRHFRVSHGVKAVVARNDEEGRILAGLAAGLWTCRSEGGGALTIVEGEPDDAGLARAAALAARYGAGRDDSLCGVVCRRGAEERRVEVRPDAEPERFLV